LLEVLEAPLYVANEEQFCTHWNLFHPPPSIGGNHSAVLFWGIQRGSLRLHI
jgi:hypothetical protein